MALELRRDEPIPDGVRRLAHELLTPAIADLDAIPEERRTRLTHRPRPLRASDRARFQKAVHETRKRMKRMRALLRLFRDDLGEDAYQFENEAIRNTARILADVRDAQVMINTLDHLAELLGEDAPPALFADVRRSLIGNLGAASRTITRRGAVDQAIGRLRAAEVRVDGWPLHSDSTKAFTGGLRKVYRRGRKDFDVALAERSVDSWHEWRKRVKYLWHQLEILAPAWPEMLDVIAEEAEEVADLLGDDHDLAVLRDRVTSRPDRFGAGPDVQHLVAVIEARRLDLETEAVERGRRLYVESPDDFADRIAGYWDAWRVTPPQELLGSSRVGTTGAWVALEQP
jgi:CHAD domain-containing protein